MPELPEVETIRRGLEQLLVGWIVEDIEINKPKLFSGDPTRLISSLILGIRRYGKGLLIDFSGGYSLAVHVKMTGQLIFKESIGKKEVSNMHPSITAPLQLPNKHTHVVISLCRNDHKAFLYYNDIRQFGWMKFVRTDDAEKMSFFASLGPEPLRNLDHKTFSMILNKSKAPIKQVLMDQRKIAGIGNIYANDALYHVGIHPLRAADSLDEREVAKLFSGVEYVLREGIASGGASEENYLNAFGEKGFYQEKFLVYKQTGKPCKRCHIPIKRIVVGGRGTFFCPKCQI